MTIAALMAGLAAGLAGLGAVQALVAWRSRSRAPVEARPLRRLALVALASAGRGTSVRVPEDLRTRMQAAGVDGSADDVMAIKAGAALGGLVIALAIASTLPGRMAGLSVVVVPATAFMAPDLWLMRRRLRRRRIMAGELADVLELLRVAVDAGLGVRRALGEVGRRHPGLLAGELRRTEALLALGVPPDAAFDALARRCPVEGIGTLLGALRRAERHGAPLGDSLAAQAHEARARHARSAAEAAARAAPKIQLIVALLLVPSAMLLIAAAMIPALVWK